MAGSRRRKRCRFCKELFFPDPRLGSRQYACAKPSCQKARNKIKAANWLKRYPDYFNGQYPKTKTWLEEHPGYLREYRRINRDYVVGDNESRKIRHQRAQETRADIQTAISTQPSIIKELKGTLVSGSDADIQTTILSQLIVISAFSFCYLSRARADIQTPIVSCGSRRYRLEHGRQTHPHP